MSFHMTHHLALFTVALLLLSHAFTIASVADGRKPSMQLSPENRSKVNRLLQEYRAAGSNLEKKREICQKVLAINPAAAPLMLKAVSETCNPSYASMTASFKPRLP